MKRIQSLVVLLATLLSTSFLFAQTNPAELYMPLNIKKAYENGTRSKDGTPGKNYWVNKTHYQLDAYFNPETRQIDGSGTITYKNNSPDTLNTMIIRLYQNIFKKGIAKDFSLGHADLHDGVNIKLLKVGNDTIVIKNTSGRNSTGTNLIVSLDNPLPPQSETTVEVKWSLIIPGKTPIRMGTYDEGNSFLIAYWYPQIAVYDDIDGWDSFQYTGMQEFYLDPSSFDVTIRIPNNWVVWGAGVLQNPEEVLTSKFLERYEEARESEDVISIIDSTDIVNDDITISDLPFNEWHFKAESSPDFVFSCANRYLWDARILELEDKTIVVQAAYKKGSEDFYQVADLAAKTIAYFSTELPGVPFPYPIMTVFNGGGGMEFPMMVNDVSAKKWRGTVHLTSHEIAHTYFPFYMGTNERKYGFMDEGWATMLPYNFQIREGKGYDPIARRIGIYLKTAGTEKDVPMLYITTSYGGNGRKSYRNSAYDRPGVAYYLLQQYLGEEKFAVAMQAYIELWHEKHPIPYDFYFTFSREAGENLNWFWKPWFFEAGYPDIGIKTVEKSEQKYQITIVNNGTMPVPVNLTILYADSSEEVVKQSMSLWKDGFEPKVVEVETDNEILRIDLGGIYLPDVNKDDNVWEKK